MCAFSQQTIAWIAIEICPHTKVRDIEGENENMKIVLLRDLISFFDHFRSCMKSASTAAMESPTPRHNSNNSNNSTCQEHGQSSRCVGGREVCVCTCVWMRVSKSEGKERRRRNRKM